MIDVTDLRKGATFEQDGNLFKVLEYSHNKPGRGPATIKIKARNLRSGGTIEKSYFSGERIQEARLDYHMAQYLYNDGDIYYFMDQENFEQYPIHSESLGESVGYLKEEMPVKLTFFGSEPLDIDLPTTVDLKVVQADIAVRGDTATGVTKNVTVETGVKVQVPNFINEGDVIRVDTRDGKYVTRVTN